MPRQPYADGITEVVRDLQAAGAGANNPLLVPRDETRRVGEVVLAADRGLCGGVQHHRDPRRRGRHPRAAGPGPRDRDRHRRAASPRATSGSATTRSTPRSAGSRRTRRYEDARAIAAAVVKPFQAGELDLVQLDVHPLHLGGPPEVVTEPLLPLAAVDGEASRCCADRARRAAGRRTSSSPSPKRSSTRCCRVYAESRIYAALLNAGRVGARGPPARDEGRDRQRRRADPRR